MRTSPPNSLTSLSGDLIISGTALPGLLEVSQGCLLRVRFPPAGQLSSGRQKPAKVGNPHPHRGSGNPNYSIITLYCNSIPIHTFLFKYRNCLLFFPAEIKRGRLYLSCGGMHASYCLQTLLETCF